MIGRDVGDGQDSWGPTEQGFPVAPAELWMGGGPDSEKIVWGFAPDGALPEPPGPAAETGALSPVFGFSNPTDVMREGTFRGARRVLRRLAGKPTSTIDSVADATAENVLGTVSLALHMARQDLGVTVELLERAQAEADADPGLGDRRRGIIWVSMRAAQLAQNEPDVFGRVT